jgi:MFS family permease
MVSQSAPAKIKRIQFMSLAILLVSGIVSYVDRATLAIANPLIREGLGLSVSEMGLLLSAFLWAYALLQMPTGALIDRLGARRLLTLGLVIWSAAQLLGAVVGNFGQFFLARFLLGAGEAPQFPTGTRVVRDWFNVRSRGFATGVFISAATLGTAIASPLLTFLMIWFGWRWMFAIMGIAGFAVAAVWYALYREPASIQLTNEERQYLNEGDTDATVRQFTFRDWRALFRFKTTWSMILSSFGAVYTVWIFTAWLPSYLEMERHMSIKQTGWWSAVPFFCGVLGSLFGGWVGDWLQAKGVSPVNSRRYPVAVGMLLVAAAVVFAALTPSVNLAIAAISLTMFLNYLAIANQWSMVSVAAPRNCTGSLGSIQNMGGYVGGALAPTITGFVVESSGSFTPALLSGAAISALGGLIYLFLARTPIAAGDLGAEDELADGSPGLPSASRI